MDWNTAVEIVYGTHPISPCTHEWFEGKCVHCSITADWSKAVRELNVKLGVEHNRTVDAERKNKILVDKLTIAVKALRSFAAHKDEDDIAKDALDTIEK